MNARPNLPSTETLLVAAAVEHVRRARGRLMAAQFLLDEAGLDCADLDDLAADTATLLATWAGRHRPPEHQPFPQHIADAAREWRSRHGRTY